MKIKIILTFILAFLLQVAFSFASEQDFRIVILGDSLTEGYGVTKDSAFPAILEQMLKKKKANIVVINSGVSGSTTASGPNRLNWILKSHPDMVLIALGSNDGLRGFKVEETKKNLAQMIEEVKKQKIKVLLAGFKMPPNYGKDYTQKFAAIFPDLAKKYQIPLIPFLLDGVAGDKNLNQTDMIHPNEKGHKKIAESVFPYIEKLL